MMNMVKELQQAAHILGLKVNTAQQESLLEYLRQLQRWNATYNLTAIRDPQKMLVQHIFDSLAVVMPLQRRWTGDVRMLDVGSGAGLPGIVIAIMQPDWHITCIDAVEKKTFFIQYVARLLDIHNLQAHHARVERMADIQCEKMYTFAISRAFASLRDFATLSQSLLMPDASLVAMKGKVPDDEITALEHETDWRVRCTETLAVPFLNAQRCLIWLHRQGKDQANIG